MNRFKFHPYLIELQRQRLIAMLCQAGYIAFREGEDILRTDASITGVSLVWGNGYCVTL